MIAEQEHEITLRGNRDRIERNGTAGVGEDTVTTRGMTKQAANPGPTPVSTVESSRRQRASHTQGGSGE